MDESYARAWRRVRRLRRSLWLGLALFAGGFWISVHYNPILLPAGHLLSGLIVAALLAGLLAVVSSFLLLFFFRCPRCGDEFSLDRSRLLPMATMLNRECVNCGLPKWADHDFRG